MEWENPTDKNSITKTGFQLQGCEAGEPKTQQASFEQVNATIQFLHRFQRED